VLTVFTLALVDQWVSPPAPPNKHRFGDGVERIMSDLVGLVVRNGRVSIPQLSVACIAASLAASWVFCHVKDRRGRRLQRETEQQDERREVVEMSAFEGAGLGLVAVAA